MSQATVREIDVAQIVAGNNDRTKFDAEALEALAGSIMANGLIQPITVRRTSPNGARCATYQIVAGERRFRACQLAEMTTVPCIVRELDDEEAAAVMLLENTSRADLDPIDEAAAYASRIRDYGWTIEHTAEQAGVSTTRVQFRIKLLALREDLQLLVRSGNLKLGYAQILADAGLDRNRQGLALQALQDNGTPTPAWFRRVVSDLLEQQAQDGLFDLATEMLLNAQVVASVQEARQALPAHPSTTVLPIAYDTLAKHAAFWTEAAAAWDGLGKGFKAKECRAAAAALETAARVIAG